MESIQYASAIYFLCFTIMSAAVSATGKAFTVSGWPLLLYVFTGTVCAASLLASIW